MIPESTLTSAFWSTGSIINNWHGESPLLLYSLTERGRGREGTQEKREVEKETGNMRPGKERMEQR